MPRHMMRLLSKSTPSSTRMSSCLVKSRNYRSKLQTCQTPDPKLPKIETSFAVKKQVLSCLITIRLTWISNLNLTSLWINFSLLSHFWWQLFLRTTYVLLKSTTTPTHTCWNQIRDAGSVFVTQLRPHESCTRQHDSSEVQRVQESPHQPVSGLLGLDDRHLWLLKMCCNQHESSPSVWII